MQAVVIAIIAALINGASIEAVLAGLTTAQELTLGEGVLEMVAPEIASAFGLPKLSPETLMLAVAKGLSDELTSKAMRDFLSANGQAAIEDQPGAGSES